jgi:hypothetical protein
MKTSITNRLILATVVALFLTTAASEGARIVAARGVGVRGVGVVAVRPIVRAPVARTVATVATVNAVSAATRPAYITKLPVGYRPIAYGGYNCFVVAGVYYRPIIYSGQTVYVIVP